MTAPVTVLTNIGRARLTNAIVLGTALHLTTIKLGSSEITPAATMTAVPDVVWTGALGSLDVDPDNSAQLIARVIVPVEAGPWTVRSAGLFDSEGNLIAIGSVAATEKVAGGSTITVTMVIAVGSEEATFITLVPSGPYLSIAEKGVPGGLATLDAGGKVPAAQLPGYVDDVLEFDNLAAFPAVGEAGKVYLAKDTDCSYRWSGSTYAMVGGTGGGGMVRNWDLTKVSAPAAISLYTGLPTVGVPYGNEGVVAGTNLSLSLAAGAPHVGVGLLAALPATGKVFWYWKPGAPAGTFAFAQNGITIGDLGTPIAQVVIAAGTGLGVTVGGGSVTPVDGAFVDADVACIYADIDAGSLGVVTANGDFADIATGLALVGQAVYAGLFGYVTAGTGMMSNDAAVTDFASGLTAPVGYSELSGLVDAPLPAGSTSGDILNVTVAGTWNNVAYTVDDGAIVAATSPAEVIPTGATTAALLAALANKVTKPLYTGFLAEVGTGKTYATLADLQAYITANALSGPMLVIDLYTGANDSMPVVDFWFPTFKEVSFKAGGSTSGSFDFGASSLIVSGSPANTYYFNTLTLTTTSYLDAKYAVFYGTTTCAGLTLRHCYTSGSTFTNTTGQADIGDFDLIPSGSSLTINFTTPTSVLLSGKSGFVTVTSNARLICQNGSSAGVTCHYTGATLATDGAAEVDVAGNFRFAQVDCGTADVPYALGVKHGGIASIDPSGANITGSGTILANFSQTANVPTADGLIMA